MADALDHLHSHEPPIIHGDVKPANLVRTAGGQVVLVDFDIAGAQAGEGRVGTIGYVAPEVAAGEKPTPAADVFGLAATAVALLSGEPAATAVLASPGLDARGARPAGAGAPSGHVRRPLPSTPVRQPARRQPPNAEDPAPPTGMVALLATEVAGAARWWHEAPEEMRVAMGRLRDLHGAVIGELGGEVVPSTDGPDHTLSVFREASTAALAALQLHEIGQQHSVPAGRRGSTPGRRGGGRGGGGRRALRGRRRRPRHRPPISGAPRIDDHVRGDRRAAARAGRGIRQHRAPRQGGDRQPSPRGSSIFGLTRPGSEATAGVQRDDEPVDASAPRGRRWRPT